MHTMHELTDLRPLPIERPDVPTGEGALMRRVRELEDRVLTLEKEQAASLNDLGRDIVRLERSLDDARSVIEKMILRR